MNRCRNDSPMISTNICFNSPIVLHAIDNRPPSLSPEPFLFIPQLCRPLHSQITSNTAYLPGLKAHDIPSPSPLPRFPNGHPTILSHLISSQPSSKNRKSSPFPALCLLSPALSIRLFVFLNRRSRGWKGLLGIWVVFFFCFLSFLFFLFSGFWAWFWFFLGSIKACISTGSYYTYATPFSLLAFFFTGL